MCLYVRPRQKNEWTAKKDIHVWKLLLQDGRRSIFKRFLYKPNTTVHIKKMGRQIAINDNNRITINEGFHAYASLTAARDSAVEDGVLSSDVVVKMTIPAGAKYYIGMYGEIVSDTLVTGDMIPVKK